MALEHKAGTELKTGISVAVATEAIHFVRITPIQQLDRGVITCDVVFRTKNSI